MRHLRQFMVLFEICFNKYLLMYLNWLGGVVVRVLDL